MHVEVAVGQQRVANRFEHSPLVTAEVIGEDQVQRGAGFWFIVVVPVRIVPSPAPRHLLRGQANKKKFSSPAASAISIVAPSRVPMVSAPFIINFILLVPLASYPAVEI